MAQRNDASAMAELIGFVGLTVSVEELPEFERTLKDWKRGLISLRQVMTKESEDGVPPIVVFAHRSDLANEGRM